MQKTPDNATGEGLLRAISVFGVAALALNGLIGAGIFALPAAAAERAGAFSPVMFIICGILMATVVLALSQAASYFRGTGGPILYAQTAFGSLVGFQTGWLLYLGRVTAMSANCNALLAYAAGFWAPLSVGFTRAIAIFVICGFFSVVNVVGVRQGMRTTNTLTVLKLLPILLFIIIGFFFVKAERFAEFHPPALDEFGGTLLLLVYAFVGFEGALVPAGESRHPKRDIPRALLLTLGGTALLYLLIQTVCVGVLPGIAQTETPLADVAGIMMGKSGIWIMTAAAVMSIAGNLSAITLTASRMTYALGRDGSLPGWFGSVHERFKTPAASIIFLGGLSFILAVTGSFKWLAITSSLTRMIGFGVCIIALPWLKKRFRDSADALNLPGGLVIPALGLLLCIWLAAQADLKAWLLTFGLISLGTVFYVISKRGRGSSREII